MTAEPAETDLQRLLEASRAGDEHAADALLPLVYDELKALAAHHLAHERDDHTLQPTALVHEAYLRMLDQRNVAWNDRIHFVRIAAQQIRRILVDHARAKGRVKRGGDLVRVTLHDDAASTGEDLDLLALDDALARLDERAPEDRQVVELKFFGGLTESEIAAVLGIGERTVRRRWSFARAWLYRELHPDPDGDPS